MFCGRDSVEVGDEYDIMNPIGFDISSYGTSDAQKAAQKDDRRMFSQSGKSLISRTSTALAGKGKKLLCRARTFAGA